MVHIPPPKYFEAKLKLLLPSCNLRSLLGFLLKIDVIDRPCCVYASKLTLSALRRITSRCCSAVKAWKSSITFAVKRHKRNSQVNNPARTVTSQQAVFCREIPDPLCRGCTFRNDYWRWSGAPGGCKPPERSCPIAVVRGQLLLTQTKRNEISNIGLMFASLC